MLTKVEPERGELLARPAQGRRFANHGILGVALIALFWALNWSVDGLRTHLAFFPLWVGYCLFIDGLVLYRTGTSLLSRARWQYLGLFLASAPAWWIFEAINARTRNWIYVGAESFDPITYALLTTLSFSTVIPAVFGTAELVGSFELVRGLRRGPRIGGHPAAVRAFFVAGLVMLALLIAAPRTFYPFVWLALYFIVEPVNVWLGNRTLAASTRLGDWRPVVALWGGVLVTAFFWEMWNWLSFPKWVYEVPGVASVKLFEMPLPGYGGYLPFSMELFAIYHFLVGLLGIRNSRYVILSASGEGTGQEFPLPDAVPTGS
jgi:hypothetical protein